MKAYLERIHLFEGQEKRRAPHDRNELLKPKQCNSWMKRIQTIGLDICGVNIKNIGLTFQVVYTFAYGDIINSAHICMFSISLIPTTLFKGGRK